MGSSERAAVLALFCFIAASAPATAQAPAQPASDLITEFVLANRILADQGVIADGFGHLSSRSLTDPTRF